MDVRYFRSPEQTFEVPAKCRECGTDIIAESWDKWIWEYDCPVCKKHWTVGSRTWPEGKDANT